MMTFPAYSLSHEILLNKLTYHGVKNSANDLLRSYLSNRKQYVQIDDISSSIVSINTSVPQGSIVGPLLFNIYISMILSCLVINLTLSYMLMIPH